MALPANLSFVTVMDVSILDRYILNGGTYTYDYVTADLGTAVHDLPFQNTVAVGKLTCTVNGNAATPTTGAGTITLTEDVGTGVVTFDLVNGDFDALTDITDGFTLTVTALTEAELITEIEDTATGYVRVFATLDTLTISNITEEGPRKEIRGGKEAQPVVRYGKTVRVEVEDAVFNLRALQYIADIDLEETGTVINTVSAMETFPKAFSLIGETYVVKKETGDRSEAYLIFYDFLPDGLFDINMESEGDIGVMSIAGELFAINNDFFMIKDKT